MSVKSTKLHTKKTSSNIMKNNLIRKSFASAFLIIPSLFLFTFFQLLFNADRGFDITDESFYILYASSPGDVLASTTQFGYYTGILFTLANRDLFVFRLFGIVLLLVTAGLFSHSLERYWNHLKGTSVVNHSRWLSLSVILAGTIAYYGFLHFTPSYNWLDLISVLIVATGLLHASVVADKGDTDKKNNRSLLGYGVIVGIGGGLSFVAKPTSAVVLAVIFFYFILITSLRHRWKYFVSFSVISSVFFICIHAITFENGLIPFFQKCQDGLELGRILGDRHTISAISLQAYEDFIQTPNRLIQIFPLPYAGMALLLIFLLFVFSQYKKTLGKKDETLFIIILMLLNGVAWIRLLITGYWEGGQPCGTRIGFGGLTFSIVLILSGLFTLLLWKKQTLTDSLYIWISFRNLLKLFLFLVMLAIAYAFGSTNGIILQLSGAFVFFSAASLYCAFWIDQHIGKGYMGYAVSLLLLLSVCLIMTSTYKNPYRLPAGLKAQTEKVTFLGTNGSIFVDGKTAHYINDLKNTAVDGGWKPGMYLIDLTGNSPGATVILGGRAPGTPWLLGKYPGSNDFARSALAKVPISILRTSWVLTAPKGKRKISNTVLSDLGIEFPNSYEVVGIMRTGYRNEKQLLMRPLKIHDLL